MSQSTATKSQPAAAPARDDLPAEVLALGKPEKAYLPSPKTPVLNIILALAAGIVGVVLLAAAANFLGVLKLPGQRPPPRTVALVLGFTGSMLGFTLLGVAFYFGSANSIGTQAYLLFRDVLVELQPKSHRIIPWTSLGQLQSTGRWMRSYRIPVHGGDDLTFNYTLPRHDVVAKAIQRRILLTALGGEANLSRGGTTPFFVCRKPAFGGGTMYRVSALGRNLLFVKVGEGHMAEKAHDFEGTFIAAADTGPVWRYQVFKANLEKLRYADERTLIEFAAGVEGCFLLSAEGLGNPEFSEPSLWNHLWHGKLTGRVRLTHTRAGTMTLHLPATTDVINCGQELSKILQRTVRAQLA